MQRADWASAGGSTGGLARRRARNEKRAGNFSESLDWATKPARWKTRRTLARPGSWGVGESGDGSARRTKRQQCALPLWAGRLHRRVRGTAHWLPTAARLAKGIQWRCTGPEAEARAWKAYSSPRARVSWHPSSTLWGPGCCMQCSQEALLVAIAPDVPH